VSAYQPQLRSVPDARKAPVPLLPVFLVLFVFLAYGGIAGSVAALYNAVALRRLKLIVAALGAALLSLACSFAIVVGAEALGWGAYAFVVLQLTYVGIGALLGWQQWAHVRGHDFLEGTQVPVLQGFLALFVLQWVLSHQVKVALLIPWVLLNGS